MRAEIGINLVIADVKMEGQSGLDLVRQIRANPVTRGLPVVMCTSASDRDTVAAAASLGVRQFVAKPVRPEILLAKVTEAFDRQEAIIEPRILTLERLRLSELEYRTLATTTRTRLLALIEELEGARAAHDCTAARRVAELVQEPALVFGAQRCVVAGQQLGSARDSEILMISAGALADEISVFEGALGRASALAPTRLPHI